MFKFVLTATVFATLALSGMSTARAAPDTARYALGGGNTVAAPLHQSRAPLARRMQGGLLRIRDVKSADGGGNGCWNACFTDFDECMGIRAKNLCVSRVKTCLETCDRLSNRPGM
jgi:hypothetical protein